MNMDNDAYRAIEAAEASVVPSESRNLLEKAITILTASGAEDSPEVQYALGYAWYLLAEETKLRADNILVHLKEALRLQPGHPYARLYLAHYYFDNEQYVEALALLSTLESEEFANFGQQWRDAKVAELVLCCKLRLPELSDLAGAIQTLFLALTRMPDELCANPDEFTATLLYLAPRSA